MVICGEVYLSLVLPIGKTHCSFFGLYVDYLSPFPTSCYMFDRPDQMDPAILRSGRFGKPILVSLPDEDERGLILKALARKKHLDPSVDLCEIAHRCENYTGADLAKLVCLMLKILVSIFFCF